MPSLLSLLHDCQAGHVSDLNTVIVYDSNTAEEADPNACKAAETPIASEQGGPQLRTVLDQAGGQQRLPT